MDIRNTRLVGDSDCRASFQRPPATHGPFNPNFDLDLSPGGIGIPNAPSHEHPPPALPPPRFVPVGGPEANHSPYFERQRHVSLSEGFTCGGSDSVYGSFRSSVHESPDQHGRGYTTWIGRDEGYSSVSSYTSLASRDICLSLRLHERYQVPSSASYDSQLLKKLDVKKNLDVKDPARGSALSASLRSSQDAPPWSTNDRLPMQLPHLSLATRFRTSLSQEPTGHADAPLTSAVSPRSTSFSQVARSKVNDYRSPIEPSSAVDFRNFPFGRAPWQNSGSYVRDMTPADPYDHERDLDEMKLRRSIRRDDRHHSRVNSIDITSPSLKRRASSPLVEESALRAVASHSDLLRRRDAISRGSPAPRLSVNPPHGSISSVSSGDRSGSLGGLSTATSLTSSQSFGRKSPTVLSPGGLSPTDVASSPYAPPNSLALSPRPSILPRHGVHHRGASDQRSIVSPRKLTEPTMRISNGAGKLQGFYMCECCPKKPKKFDTCEELSAHEAEKQYECHYCGNRFKNKNEAERHQNSLHLRRHSWSCSALLTYDRAFHESTTRPGEADTCGYCGEEFARTGFDHTAHVRQAAQSDWDVRVRHLQDHHKFRECNSSKKFYRADHFRQHLKHSHAGTSGKWTNMLENACMMEEELPQMPRHI